MMVKQTAVRNKVSVSYCFNFVSVRRFVFDTSMVHIYIGITVTGLVYSHGIVDGVVSVGHLVTRYISRSHKNIALGFNHGPI